MATSAIGRSVACGDLRNWQRSVACGDLRNWQSELQARPRVTQAIAHCPLPIAHCVLRLAYCGRLDGPTRIANRLPFAHPTHMIRIAISGVPGRLAVAVAAGVETSPEMELVAVFNPKRPGQTFGNLSMTTDHAAVVGDVVFESTDPDVVMTNLRAWRNAGMYAVVGTSGFTTERIETLRGFWGDDGPGCLIVPNFSIGAVLMMRFAEQAAPHFSGVEIVERHHHDKPDAPSGTSIATAARISAAGGSSIELSKEMVSGSRGGVVDGIRIHSLRMEATLSDQEVAYSRPGSCSRSTMGTAYGAYVDGALLAMRYVTTMSGVEVGLDGALDWRGGPPLRARVFDTL